MLIGQLAKRAGVHVETVRYYERRGLLPRPVRTASGYRTYEPAVVARLCFIKRAQGLGFTLHEVEELLALRAGDSAACELLGRRTREKTTLVRQKIRELLSLERSLSRLSAECEAQGPTGECPILHALEGLDDV
jgi:Hg(II)-responsive transcriptional regulator